MNSAVARRAYRSALTGAAACIIEMTYTITRHHYANAVLGHWSPTAAHLTRGGVLTAAWVAGGVFVLASIAASRGSSRQASTGRNTAVRRMRREDW